MKRLLIFAAAFAALFVSGAHTQEVPAEKPDPDCKTISGFFPDHVEYILREHRDFLDMKFAFVPKDNNIVIFMMSGPCIGGGMGYVVRPNHPNFQDIFNRVFAGGDA